MRFYQVFSVFILILFAPSFLCAQASAPIKLPYTIKEFRLHAPAVLSFGVYKPLNEKDLIGAKVIGGLVFPALAGGAIIEYRHYFRPMNTRDNKSKGSFLYGIKPYMLYAVAFTPTPHNTKALGISGSFGYEWVSKSGFFIRPAIEPNLPIINSEDAFEDIAGASIAQSFVSSIALGFKW